MADFDAAIAPLLTNEGGYVNDSADPGGETKYGISKRSYPSVNIAALTLDDAKAIYRRDYWRFDDVHDQRIATKLLDMAVNMGKLQMTLMAQKAVSAQVDGMFGQHTIEAINSADAEAVLRELRYLSATFYTRLVLKDAAKVKFLNSWLRRAVA